MNLIFICISLEPGRDGVGDYSRQLAGELYKQGNRIAIVALSDKFLKEEWSGVQKVNNNEIPVIRIPATWSEERRFKQAKLWIDTLNPEWLSLQFSPFGFHNKGLPFRLGHALSLLGKDRKWHIMFHELWVGMDRESSFKHIVWGWLQSKIVGSIIKKLSPEVIHTHVQLYQLQLSKFKSVVNLLPLPSNIPLPDHIIFKEPSEMVIIFVIFGAIHFGAPIRQFVNEVRAYSEKKGISSQLVLIGRSNSEQQSWVTEWESQGLSVTIAGEQPAEKVSEILLKASYGISTTPISLLGKSSSVSTMKAHGLPILCVSRPWRSRIPLPLEVQSYVLNYQPGNLEHFLSVKHGTVVHYTVSEVVNQFIASLHTN